MKYSIEVSGDKRYIILTILGSISRESAMLANIEAHKLGNELGINKYFVDLTQAINSESVLENYEFAYTDMKRESIINRFAKVVMLVSADDHSHDFIETLSVNTGLNVKLFRDHTQALNHLLSK